MASRTCTSVATRLVSDRDPVLPGFVASAWTPTHVPALAAADLPPELMGAAAKRQREFLAGRASASAALAQLGIHSVGVGIAAGGAPVWPPGIVGSISHTNGLAWAAVARERDAAGVGIDAEPVMADDRAARIAPRLATAGELARAAAQSGFDRAAALTLLFSAKEAFYKCLYPEVRRAFDYLDVRVDSVEIDRGRITLVLAATLTNTWRTGATLDGGFDVRDGLVRVAFVR